MCPVLMSSNISITLHMEQIPAEVHLTESCKYGLDYCNLQLFKSIKITIKSPSMIFQLPELYLPFRVILRKTPGKHCLYHKLCSCNTLIYKRRFLARAYQYLRTLTVMLRQIDVNCSKSDEMKEEQLAKSMAVLAGTTALVFVSWFSDH